MRPRNVCYLALAVLAVVFLAYLATAVDASPSRYCPTCPNCPTCPGDKCKAFALPIVPPAIAPPAPYMASPTVPKVPAIKLAATPQAIDQAATETQGRRGPVDAIAGAAGRGACKLGRAVLAPVRFLFRRRHR